MKYGNVGTEIYLSNIEKNIISTTPVPMTIPEDAMSPGQIPTSRKVDITLDRSEVIRLYMCRNDRSAMSVCIYGGKEGASIKSARVCPLPQDTAPVFETTGIRPDSKKIVKGGLFEYILAGNTGAFMVEAQTLRDTKPGVYKSILEIELIWPEAGAPFAYIPVEVYVYDILLNPKEFEGESVCYTSALDALLDSYAAFKEGRAVKPERDKNSMYYKCSVLASYDLALLETIAQRDNLADCVADLLCAYKGEQNEDSVIYRTRKAMLTLLNGKE